MAEGKDEIEKPTKKPLLSQDQRAATRRTTIRETSLSEAQPHLEVPYGLYLEVDIQSYDNTFRNVMRGESTVDFLRERKAKGLSTSTLDLMSPGIVMRDICRNLKDFQVAKSSSLLDTGLSVTLGDGRMKEEKRFDDSNNLQVLAGNIIFKDTWKRIKGFLQHHQLKGFDLIIFRPVGGFDTLPRNQNFYYYLLNQAWRTLANNEGVILAQIPRDFEEIVAKWAEESKEHPGLNVTYAPPNPTPRDEQGRINLKLKYETEYGTLRIIKFPNSPQNIPSLNG